MDTEVVKPKKRKSRISPTRRTLKFMRGLCWIAETVEQRLPKCFITRDLFNVIDIVAISPPDDDGFRNTLGIQVTSGSNHAARREKSLNEPLLRAWLEAKNLFEVQSWDKQGRGKRKTWTLRREPITLGMLAEVSP